MVISGEEVKWEVGFGIKEKDTVCEENKGKFS